jgi:glycine dehydrogenase subunit 1
MTVFGKEGLRELAEQNLAKAHYLAGEIQKRGGELAFNGPFFNEFVIRANGVTAAQVNERAIDDKIIGGLDLGRFYPELAGSMLVCATEMNRREEMDRFAEKFDAQAV